MRDGRTFSHLMTCLVIAAFAALPLQAAGNGWASDDALFGQIPPAIGSSIESAPNLDEAASSGVR